MAFADVVVMNKADLFAEEALELLRQAVRALNRTDAVITLLIYASHRFPAGCTTILIGDALELEPELLSDAPHDHEHDTSIRSCALVESGALDPDWWINQLVEQHSTDAFAAAIGRGASLYRPYWREPSGRE